jgi:hypothetical protein
MAFILIASAHNRGYPRVLENISYRDFALCDGPAAFGTNVDTVPGEGWLRLETIESNNAIVIGEDQ